MFKDILLSNTKVDIIIQIEDIISKNLIFAINYQMTIR